MLSHPGLPLNNETLRTVLRTLISIVPQTEGILASGKRDVSKWQAEGNVGKATAADIASPLSRLTTEQAKTATKADGATAWNTWNDAIDAWDGVGTPPTLGN